MAIAAGSKALGSDFQNLAVKTHAPGDTGTTTSLSYTTTRSGATSPVGVALTVPPSGKIVVQYSSGIQNSGASQSLVSFQVLTGSTVGSGSSLQAFSESFRISHVGTSQDDQGRISLVSGLTAGNNINVSLGFRVAGGTGSFGSPELVVTPCIA